jgi:hypothetical protein
MSSAGLAGLPCFRSRLIVEAEQQMLEACGLTKPYCSPVARCSACDAVKLLNPPFEVLLAPGAYSPASDNGNGLIWVCRHGVLNVLTLNVIAK